MSYRETSMDTTMEDSDSFVSDTDAIIYGTSDHSGRTESLISDPNIPNSSSTSENEYQQQSRYQYQISTAAGGRTDDLIVSSCASSSWFENNNKQSVEHREIRIFNVDFRALSEVSYVQPAHMSKAADNLAAATELQMSTSRSLPENLVPNQSQMNHINHGVPLLDVSSESLMRPIKGISVYHHHRSSSSFRCRWTPSLHALFVDTVELLGGHKRATSKSILELMDIKDLTLAKVRSHLKMYRAVKIVGEMEI